MGQEAARSGGLRATDFEVLDNDQPREITFFSEQRAQLTGAAVAAAPTEPARAASPSTASAPRRSIALFFDDAHASMLGVRKSAEAAEKLVANTLAPDDLVGIFTSSGTVSADFTSDRIAPLEQRSHACGPIRSVEYTPPPSALRSGRPRRTSSRNIRTPMIEEAAVDEAVGCNCPNPQQLRACTVEQREVVRSAAQNVWQQYEYQSTTRAGRAPHCDPPLGGSARRAPVDSDVARLPDRRHGRADQRLDRRRVAREHQDQRD